MENIGEVVISKVKAEALDIIKEAEARAREEREKASGRGLLWFLSSPWCFWASGILSPLIGSLMAC